VRNIARLLFLISFLFVASFATAGDENSPSIEVSVNRKRIFVGDKIRYKTQITSRDNLEIEFPVFKDSKIGDCEIKNSGRSLKKPMFGNRTYINWMDLTSYYVGKRTIPSIEIKYREKGEDHWKQLKTDELTFTVETVLPKGVKLTDIKDIKGVLYPFSPLRLIIWIAGSLIVLWLLGRFIAKMIFKKAPPKLPHEIALEELRAASKQLAAGGAVKEYYVRVSDAVRRYIETVFSLKASEMTTQEFLISLSDTVQSGSSKLSVVYKDLLKVFMEACDLVKFAKYTPARNDIESVFNTASNFIEETKEIYMNPVPSKKE